MNKNVTHIYIFLLLLVIFTFLGCHSDNEIRRDILLNEGWSTIANDTNRFACEGFQVKSYQTNNWLQVNIPHNWDDYGGYRRLVHGNRHGYAWYKKSFILDSPITNNHRYFLFFEGVGSYATVWLNGDSIGYHAGGRTSFTLDVTSAIHKGENILAVRADHPANIRDLPWVCGGCSPEWGFSEGSQPLGIFRPVHLMVTRDVRIEPFGVHIWNDKETSTEKAGLNLTTEIRNYSEQKREIKAVNRLLTAKGAVVKEIANAITLLPGQTDTIFQKLNDIENPILWSIENPYLYRVETEITENGKMIDKLITPYGIRWIKWDVHTENSTNRFYLNDKPVFINGTAEYEHMFGQSHAFSDEQIKARIAQVQSMGFNSFRDGHQPHNFKYHQAWDSLGMLWWPQMAAHIWFDTPEFRANFKTLLHDWVKERRNSPSIILWGLENESTLPTDFAQECVALIREMDPTTSSQRLVTTCNGGTGTDWNVIQNWSGTYGGNPEIYDEEISNQLLNGEYGAWRSIDLHSEGDFDIDGILSEDRMTLLMESKIRLAEKVNDKCCGQYHWLFNSHDNPGRIQGGEGYRELDRLGPLNYKGTVSSWGEPLDVFYMYRSNYADKNNEPMVYIASHTWPNRWTEPGIKNGIRVYSNCDEVELFNGIRENSLGKQKKAGIGTHFKFDSVNIQTNIIYAVAYVDGKEMATDQIVLNHLPVDGNIESLQEPVVPLQNLDSNQNVIYRVNCGGPDYIDTKGNLWMADVHKTGNGTWGSVSWTDDYDGLPAFYGSQRQTYDPIKGTNEWPLIQTFRYGRHKLNYQFPLPNGEFTVELFFVEPWYGTGGGMDCENWRLFDVAINDNVILKDLDIWKEVGHDHLLKKTVKATITGGALKISFPQVKSGQAVISAIAISTSSKNVKPAPSSPHLMTNLIVNSSSTALWSLETWMNTGLNYFADSIAKFVSLPPVLFGAEWIKTPAYVINNKAKLATFNLNDDADVFIGINTILHKPPKWLDDYSVTKHNVVTTLNGITNYHIYQKRYKKGEIIELLPISNNNVQSMYLVAAVPVSKLDDPIDLRQSVQYEAENGKLFGQAKRVDFMKKTCIEVPGHEGSIGFVFNVGLASKYGLEFRYMNMSDRAVEADVEIRAADNRLIWNGKWSFLPANIKWQSFRTDTQTTINAGEYTIKITPNENVQFYFDWVKVQ